MTKVQKTITAPDTFDIFGGYNYQDIQMWSSHHMLPIDTSKIKAWPQLYKLFAYGKNHPGSKSRRYGDGDAPFRALFLKQGTTGLPLTKEGPRSNKDIVQWYQRDHRRNPRARCPGTSSGRRPTSTPTRSATTPTSSRSSRTRSGGRSS